LSDSRKVEETNNVSDLETAREGHLLWKHPTEGATPVNIYFESIPRKLVTAIYLESGLLV
jgi:translation initiation factor 2B subunit (eIF-2B alpha/beta/delta family)